MVVEFQNPDVVDPLEGYSVLSLLPRTFRDLKKTGNSDQDNMESIHNYLKSQALKSPNKILEQAKIILQSSSENQNSEFPCHVQPEDKGKNTSTLGKDRPQERRPALGRKRAKFSLKPNARQLSLDEDTSLDISQFQDPEDFFLAFEKLENAKKELQKQRGEISTDSIQHNRSARTRRPGILGRKVGYTHRYSSVLVNGDEAIAPSQGMFEMDSPGPSNSGINTYQHETLQERELAGDGCMNTIQDSVANTENRVDTLLDELLSANTDLDGDGAFTFLQERLQIKPIKLDNLCLPDLDGIRRSAFKTSVDQFTRPRKALSDIHNMITQVKDMHREVVASKELELGVKGLTMGTLHCSASQLDNPDPTSGEHHPMDGHSEIVDILPGQNNEVGQNEDMLPGQNTEVSQIVDILPGENEVGHFVSQNTEISQNNEVGQNEDILPRQNAEISQIVGILPGQNEKPSGMSANEHGKHKAPTHNRRKRNELSNRKSLAGAGTVWESGVRRSSRIKMRPLEFWRGERFLYGRVHDTLLTVIGVKYGSPAKGDGKTTLKVESFVSDEYKELVEKAALH